MTATRKLRVLDLFSGIGGFSLGLERTGGFETVAFCEIEEFPRKVLKKHWPEIYCHKDVRTLTKEALWNGYAENAAANHLCKVTGGNLASVKSAIESIRENAAAKTLTSTTNGPQNADEALLNIMAESVVVAGKPNTHFWQSITLIMTAAQNAKSTNELLGKSLSSADFQTVIKFFVTTATWQKPFTEHARMKAAMGVKFFHDVREFTADRLKADGIAVDVITGGFPCQDVSKANCVWGDRLGLSGERTKLFSEILRLADELGRPTLILENATGILEWMGEILSGLAQIGYDVEWHCIPAAAVGAPHYRDRFWLVADCSSKRQQGIGIFGKCQYAGKIASAWGSLAGAAYKDVSMPGWHQDEPPILRVDDGVPGCMDIASLGNAVVPQIPELIGHAILHARDTA